jgi:hypothetical protein
MRTISKFVRHDLSKSQSVVSRNAFSHNFEQIGCYSYGAMTASIT